MAWIIDIPTEHTLGPDGLWLHVHTAPTKEEAVAWIRKHIGPCDDEGNINLLTECPDAEQVVEP